jgi:hypothetical protein
MPRCATAPLRESGSVAAGSIAQSSAGYFNDNCGCTILHVDHTRTAYQKDLRCITYLDVRQAVLMMLQLNGFRTVRCKGSQAALAVAEFQALGTNTRSFSQACHRRG